MFSKMSLLEDAAKLTDHGFLTIPLSNGTPSEKYDKRREKLASEHELNEWFSNNNTNGLAIAINKAEFAIDTDGICETAFLNEIIPLLSENLRNKISNTMFTKTPHGYHRTFRIKSEDFPEGVNEKVILKLKDHNEIVIIGKKHILRERGPDHKVINDVDRIITLDKNEVNELFNTLDRVGIETNAVIKVTDLLSPYYYQPHRDNIVFTLSGYLHKNKTPKYITKKIVYCIFSLTNYPDEDRNKTLRIIDNTYEKDSNSDQVSGYTAFLEALENAYPHEDKIGSGNGNGNGPSGIINKIQEILGKAGLFTINSRSSRQQNSGYNEEDITLPDDLAIYDLDKDIYGILNFNPTVLAVARSKSKQIVKAKVIEHKYEDGSKQTQVNRSLLWINAIVDAIPINKVVRHENPIDEKNTTNYTIMFISKGMTKPFTIGPVTISKMVEHLTDKGKVLKKLAVTDTLTSLIAAYEKSGRIEVDNQIPTPGFYWIDGQIKAYHVTQRLDFDPWNNEEHKKEVIECIKIFDEWQHRNKKKVALPSALKWTTLAPFGFITKTHSRGVDRWLPSLYLYLTTDTGKTTLVRDGVLAPWGIYSDGENSHIHLKGPGSLDSPSKFGIAASQSTLMTLGDEVGNMFNDNDRYGGNNILLDMQKFSVQNKYIRTKFNDDILALTSFAFTSNDPPPNDGAARRRFFAIQFMDGEQWDKEEKENYEKWMNEVIESIGKSRREMLSVYGDFVASYVIKNPQLVFNYSSYTWHEPATIILKEFYKSAGVELPEWLDLLAEQTIVQEAKEERQFELRGFLRQCIMKSYKDNLYAIPDSKFMVAGGYGPKRSNEEPTFKDLLDYCLRNKTVQFLHRVKRNSGKEVEVAITSNIKSEMKRQDKNMLSVTMETIASKMPGFYHGKAKVNKDVVRAVCGPLPLFEEYLDYDIEKAET